MHRTGDTRGADGGYPRRAGCVRIADAITSNSRSARGASEVRVAIDGTFALADARAAHERAARGHIQGKLVLTVA